MRPDRALNYSLTNTAVRELLCALLAVLSSPPLTLPLLPSFPPSIFTDHPLHSESCYSLTCCFPLAMFLFVSLHAAFSIHLLSLLRVAHLSSWVPWPIPPIISCSLVPFADIFFSQFYRLPQAFPTVHIGSSHSPCTSCYFSPKLPHVLRLLSSFLSSTLLLNFPNSPITV